MLKGFAFVHIRFWTRYHHGSEGGAGSRVLEKPEMIYRHTRKERKAPHKMLKGKAQSQRFNHRNSPIIPYRNPITTLIARSRIDSYLALKDITNKDID